VAPHSDRFMYQTVAKQRNSGELDRLMRYKNLLCLPTKQTTDKERRKVESRKNWLLQIVISTCRFNFPILILFSVVLKYD
jgi:hypothetical protein